MPSIKVITPILGGRYYHIFNRGVNKQRVFFLREILNSFLRYQTGILLNICTFQHIVCFQIIFI